MATSLPTFPSFEVRDGDCSLGSKWKTYIQKMENLFIALDVKTDKRQKALLLHLGGDDVFQIYQTLPDIGDASGYTDTKEALNKFFQPKVNTEFEIFEFRQMKQELNETLDKYTTRLRQKATNCDFDKPDNEIKSQIIQGTNNNKLRRKALGETMDLQKLLIAGRTIELSAVQANKMAQNEIVDKVNYKPRGQSHNKPPDFRKRQSNRTCRNCGGNYPHKSKCPALGASCNYCHKPNHFEIVCRNRKYQNVHMVEEEQEHYETEEECAFGINVNKIHGKVPNIQVKICGENVRMLVDTGSSIDIISEQLFEKLNPKPKLSAVNAKAYAFAQEKPLQVRGKFTSTMESQNKLVISTLHVIRNNHESIMGYTTAVELGIVPSINTVTTDSKCGDICHKYVDVFDGLGKLKDRKVKLHVDESVTPTAQQHRRIPFHIREKVEQELERLESLDVIEKVEGPTPWVSPIVAAPKPNAPSQIRLCVDMRKANEAIRRERHVTPTIDDIIFKLNGATVFSKVDLLNGFHQIELDEGSRNITTFATHVGLRRYKRLNFGVSAAPEIFENEIRQALDGLKGVMSIADDICIFGKTQCEHDENLDKLMQRLRERNLTLNKDKSMFNQSKITFYGYVFGPEGLSADPRKVEAIQSTEQPKNAADVRSFLGMTNYVSRFIQDYSTITEPLRKLTQKGAKWQWTESQMHAFDTLKNVLTSDQVMTYFDPAKHTEIFVDASPVGLGAILIQDKKIVSYASRSLTPVESRYSQTEREALAVVWGCEHYHLYVFGSEFTIYSDNKALESIFNNTKTIQSARLERWRLRMVTYNFKVKHVQGNRNTADYMSRHPVECSRKRNVAEEYVNFLANSAESSAIRIPEVASATQKDKTLCDVMRAIQTNKWTHKTQLTTDAYKCYYKLADELAVLETDHGNVLLRGTRLCIPEKLQQPVINLAHRGHQGQVKSKALLRETCWFPSIDKMVEKTIKHCIPCMASTPQTNTEPLKPSNLPKSVWDELSIDFCGPMPDSSYFMVLIDDYSRFPIVENISAISAKSVIPRLESIWATFGIPSVLKSDNGPPFNGTEFSDFAQEYGFKHRKITPLHPMANGCVERFMQPLQKAIKAAHADGLNYKREIIKFLQNYRATPHPATLLSPAELMFSRKPQTTLPAFKRQPKDKYVRKRDTTYKQSMKRYADQRRHATRANLQAGDSVLVKQRRKNKLSAAFCPKPGTIISTKGSMVRAKIDDRIVTRDASNFKKVPHVNADVSIDTSARRQQDRVSSDVNTDVSTGTSARRQQDRVSSGQPTAHYRVVPPRVRKRPKRFGEFI